MEIDLVDHFEDHSGDAPSTQFAFILFIDSVGLQAGVGPACHRGHRAGARLMAGAGRAR
jgi:hypothetical protein